MPGVRQVALVSGFPTAAGGQLASRSRAGRSPPDQPSPVAELRLVTPDYFQTMQIPMLRGRDDRRRWWTRPRPVEVVINQTLANKYWPGEDPVGPADPGSFGPQGPMAHDRGRGRRRAAGGAGPAAARGAVSLQPALSRRRRWPFVVRTDGRSRRGSAAAVDPGRSARSIPTQPVFGDHADGEGAGRCRRRAAVLAPAAHPVRRAWRCCCRPSASTA